MTGTPIGGKRSAETMKKRYGDKVHEIIGRAGGVASGKSPKHNRFTKQQAREAGRKGGKVKKNG